MKFSAAARKSNPCLLGEPGVGKSALAEALAQRIAAGQITPALRGKRVLALDMASMVAGTKYRGDFEERFKNLLEELYRDRSTILFIDEIHLIAGAGAAEGAIDAASILKPMLARGEIQLIGATTPEEYRKTIQKDSALERRFGRVMVEEPTPAAAETILAGLMPRYERYHGVSIPPEAIHAAVELSVRYLPGRYLPDKAIDLLDEAAAARRIADASGNRRALSPRRYCKDRQQGQRRARRARRAKPRGSVLPIWNSALPPRSSASRRPWPPWHLPSDAAAPACGRAGGP